MYYVLECVMEQLGANQMQAWYITCIKRDARESRVSIIISKVKPLYVIEIIIVLEYFMSWLSYTLTTKILRKVFKL